MSKITLAALLAVAVILSLAPWTPAPAQSTFLRYHDIRDLRATAQATPNMTVAVASGEVYVGTTRVTYAGGNSGTFTAPGSNNRIDLLTINASGTLAITTGTAGASPSAPTCPVDVFPICLVYLKSTSTSIQAYNTGTATHGYIYKDVRPFLTSLTGDIVSNDIQAAGGDLKAGLDDTLVGEAHLYGHATGSADGGCLKFYNAADHDGTFESWNLNIDEDDLNVKRGTTTVFTWTGADGHVRLANTYDLIPATSNGSELGDNTHAWNQLYVTQIGPAGDADLLQLASGALMINGTLGCGAITSSGAVTGTSLITGANIGVAADADLLALSSGQLNINGILYTVGFLRFAREALTISAGVVTATSSYIKVDTEGAAASDDLDTIDGGAVGGNLIVRQANDARDVTLKDGTGNLVLAGGADFNLATIRGRIMLVKDGGDWYEISRSVN